MEELGADNPFYTFIVTLVNAHILKLCAIILVEILKNKYSLFSNETRVH